MRYLAAFAVLFSAGLSIAVLPHSARSEKINAVAEKTEVKVSLSVIERHGTPKPPLRVVIENKTDKPQGHFEEWNSWGYGNLSLHWTDAAGKTGTVSKVPAVFTVNYPSTVILEPGDVLVREITFDSELWRGWPDLPKGTKLTVTVIYESTGMPSTEKADGWIGKVTSKPQTVVFRR